MGLCVVLATGQSVTGEQVDCVREMHEAGACQVVAISDAYLRMPTAEALVSNDLNWWRHHPEALQFAGRKFCGHHCPGTERLQPTSQFSSGTNSGLQGMRVARDYLKATRILLVGFDMHGTHYFGKHPEPLRNTTPARFTRHLAQFRVWSGCEVINCTPGSALTRFEMGDLREALRTGDFGAIDDVSHLYAERVAELDDGRGP